MSFYWSTNNVFCFLVKTLHGYAYKNKLCQVLLQCSIDDCERVIYHVLPVNGRHLWFPTRPDIGLYLSYIRAEIYVISYPLPVSGRHLCFRTYRYIEQHRYFLLRVSWHWKRVITFEIVLLSCKLADIWVITIFQPPSWLCDFRFHLWMLLTAPLKSLTPKTWE